MREHLTEIIGRFEGKRIVVLCDLVLDEFLHGEIARVSREAPVLIVDYLRTDAMPGGGGNAVQNLQALGCSPLPVGVVGEDAEGRRLLDVLSGAGIDTSGIARLAGYVTPVKTRVLTGLAHSRPQQVIRIDRGSPRSVPADAAGAAGERARALVAGGAAALLLSDYGYDLVTPEAAAAAIAAARDRGVPATCDSRHRLTGFDGVTAATPNLEEAEEVIGRRLEQGHGGENALEEAGKRLIAKMHSRAMLITRGADGMTLVEDGVRAFHVPAFGAGEVADVTGAGDTVIAVFTLALACGAAMRAATLLANCAAGLVVMKRGTATVSASELAASLDRLEVPGA